MSSVFQSQHGPNSKYFMQKRYASISKFSFRPTTKQPKMSCTPRYTCSYVPPVQSVSCGTLRPSCSTPQPPHDLGLEQLPNLWCVCSAAARIYLYHVPSTRARLPQHNIPQYPLDTGYHWRNHHRSWPRRKSPLQGLRPHTDRSDHSCACWWLSVQVTDPGVQP